MDCTYIGVLASGIWDDIGSPTAISVNSISGKLLSSGTLGKLNNDINTCYFIGSGGCICPELGSEEQDIYRQGYLLGYYTTAALQAVGNPALLWNRIAEGDTTISRDSPIALAKFYQTLQNSAFNQYRLLVNEYRSNHSAVRSIDYLNPPRHPRNGFGAGCNWRC